MSFTWSVQENINAILQMISFRMSFYWHNVILAFGSALRHPKISNSLELDASTKLLVFLIRVV